MGGKVGDLFYPRRLFHRPTSRHCDRCAVSEFDGSPCHFPSFSFAANEPKAGDDINVNGVSAGVEENDEKPGHVSWTP